MNTTESTITINCEGHSYTVRKGNRVEDEDEQAYMMWTIRCRDGQCKGTASLKERVDGSKDSYVITQGIFIAI